MPLSQLQPGAGDYMIPKQSYGLNIFFILFSLAKLRHRFLQVLWRYKGKTPDTLGPNTRLYDWIPQNDLLGKRTMPEKKNSDGRRQVT